MLGAHIHTLRKCWGTLLEGGGGVFCQVDVDSVVGWGGKDSKIMQL